MEDARVNRDIRDKFAFFISVHSRVLVKWYLWSVCNAIKEILLFNGISNVIFALFYLRLEE
jgi:hypothetical protein